MSDLSALSSAHALTLLTIDKGIPGAERLLAKRYGLQESDELMVEETPQGLLLRPCVSMPIEFYSEERIAEFTEDDAAIGTVLDQLEKDS